MNTGLTEKEIEQKFGSDFRGLFPKLKKATAIPVTMLTKDSSESRRIADMILRLKVRDKTRNLLCEVISQRYPKQLREKGLQLLEISQRGTKGYPVIIASYISELGREICKK